jgi:hypothetical protein
LTEAPDDFLTGFALTTGSISVISMSVSLSIVSTGCKSSAVFLFVFFVTELKRSFRLDLLDTRLDRFSSSLEPPSSFELV